MSNSQIGSRIGREKMLVKALRRLAGRGDQLAHQARKRWLRALWRVRREKGGSGR